MAIRRKIWYFIINLMISVALAQGQQFFPIQDVRPGLRGVGKTVFQGNRIEEFQVEILGVLDEFAPKQAIILARLSGGPLAETGILQGMSGSPVYINGKLLGAVALGFPFSKEPICGIQPIQSMLADSVLASNSDRVSSTFPSSIAQQFSLLSSQSSLSSHSSLSSLSAGLSHLGEMADILTPLSLEGLSPQALMAGGPSLENIGLSIPGLHGRHLIPQEAVQISGRNSLSDPAILPPGAASVQPGSMISVGLVTGDWNMTADGTVTYVDGQNIYAFGHKFLGLGSTEMPLASSDVVASIPDTNSSFKISEPRQWIGAILSDHATAIAGRLGQSAHTIPISVTVDSSRTGQHTYRLQVVRDRLLTPFLTQAVLASTLDATEKTIGVGTLKLQGSVHFDGNLPPLVVHDIFVSDSGLTQQASADAVVTLAFVLGGGFGDLHVNDMEFRLDQFDRKKQLRLAQAWTSAHAVRAGETVDVTAVLQGEGGVEVVKSIPYRVPEGAPLGALNLTLSDGNTLNFPEFAGVAQTQFQTPAALIEAINRYRNSESLYVRVWRQQPAFNVAGAMPGGELSDPPPSVALILADPSASASGGATAGTRGSDVAQLTVPLNGFVVTGAKTIQIEVTE